MLTPDAKIRKAVLAAIRNVILGGNAASLGLGRQPRKLVGYTAETRFLYRTYADRRGVTQKTVFEICGDRSTSTAITADITLAWGTPGAQQWLQPIASYAVDIMSLCALCALLKPKVVFEIGTLTGYTAFNFALNTPPETTIYTLDLPEATEDVPPSLRTTVVDDAHIRAHRDIGQYAWDGHSAADKIMTLFGDSARFDYKPYERAVDLFFIDGAHSYEYVRQDTINALTCLHSGSVLGWHDYGRAGVNGVSRWIDELAKEREIYAVPGGSLAFTVLP